LCCCHRFSSRFGLGGLGTGLGTRLREEGGLAVGVAELDGRDLAGGRAEEVVGGGGWCVCCGFNSYVAGTVALTV